MEKEKSHFSGLLISFFVVVVQLKQKYVDIYSFVGQKLTGLKNAKHKHHAGHKRPKILNIFIILCSLLKLTVQTC